MLLQFSVENFKSFKERTVLSLEGSSDKALPNNYVEDGKNKFLKVVSIFGANAAGKSNIFMALTAAILTVRQSATRQINEPLWQIVPFKFDDESSEKPTSFEFVFIAEGKKYVYGFSATRESVLKEYLYVYNTSKASTVFERDKDTYDFKSPAKEREMRPLTERNTSNMLFLATATQWNCEDTKVPFLWFAEGINTYSTEFEPLLGQTAPMYENDENNALKRFTNNLLRKADINIDDFEIEIKNQTKEQFVSAFPPELREFLSTAPISRNKSIKIETVHSFDCHGERKQYRLSLSEESRGTKDLFLFAPVLRKAFETGETLCIDELGRSLHPLLVEFIISLFNDPEININNAQLIISSHSVHIMSLSLLRRDQIYFVEKDRDTGVSELYSLDEFSPRKDEKVGKSYLMGRYGSIPFIPNGDL